ncbi:hypothetical protein BKA67DRAFT_530960 [Truncatella angustata]|uniref:Uncharacterized protein n=1 Tax=Truncatella angustata TaxID=152316 RepID=A0A9P8UZ61_9PEZI|nr:uncharacterized protein BKA67DRAFT_530960 [Truncatella angustata]KAH6660877.1 hypothetical protein BKA67DRAFT_530960 [Truncatella angustata]KAH8199239.1 hypothetical protein TruAng_006579 [Truncatella angustata]
MRSSQVIAVVLTLLPAFSAAVPQARSSTTLKTSAKASSTNTAAAAGAGNATSSATSAAGASASSSSSSARGASASSTSSAVPAVDSSGVTMGMQMVSDTQIANAVLSWMNDTGKVTNFLDSATSFTGDEFTRQATIALNAEKDELNHKNILDAAMGTQPDVQAANNVLAMQGTFQMVVDTLQKMVDQGPDTAQADVDAINQNRCVNVLPNIDKYFAAAGSSTISASRPTGCLEITSAPTGTAAAGAGNAAAPASTTSSAAASASSTSAGGASAGSSATSAASSTSSSAASSTSKAGAAAAAKTTSKAAN